MSHVNEQDPPAVSEMQPNGDTRDPTPVPRRVFHVLGGFASAVTIISGLLYVIWVVTGYNESPMAEIFHLFDVAGEFNFAAWVNAGLWLLLAVAAGAVAAHTRRRRVSWILLAIVAAYASVDEFAMLHERFDRLGGQLAAYLPFDPFSYRWVIAGLAFALVVVILLAPLMLSLPRRILLGYVIAGFIFLFGAVVMETVGGFVERQFNFEVTWHLKLIMHIEEWLEMVGVALAVAVTTAMIRWERVRGGVATSFAGYRA